MACRIYVYSKNDLQSKIFLSNFKTMSEIINLYYSKRYYIFDSSFQLMLLTRLLKVLKSWVYVVAKIMLFLCCCDMKVYLKRGDQSELDTLYYWNIISMPSQCKMHYNTILILIKFTIITISFIKHYFWVKFIYSIFLININEMTWLKLLGYFVLINATTTLTLKQKINNN